MVNQILSCLDGVNAIPNILLIGMTNRRELLDEALLRPGRLEVQIEIPLPDREGRREILQIHFEALRRRGRLSMPLCCAIDGVPFTGQQQQQQVDGTSTNSSNSGGGDNGSAPSSSSPAVNGRRLRFRDRLRALSPFGRQRKLYDLAEDYATAGFSGADLAGLGE